LEALGGQLLLGPQGQQPGGQLQGQQPGGQLPPPPPLPEHGGCWGHGGQGCWGHGGCGDHGGHCGGRAGGKDGNVGDGHLRMQPLGR